MNFYAQALMVLIGAIIVVWGIISINNFIGGSPIFMYVGTPLMIGVGVIFFGFLVYYLASNNLHLLEN